MGYKIAQFETCRQIELNVKREINTNNIIILAMRATWEHTSVTNSGGEAVAVVENGHDNVI